MRKLVFAAVVVCLCASVATAQGKIEAGWKCAKATAQHALDVGDQPNHAYSIDQFKCTATQGEIAGVKDKEGTGTEFMEANATGSSGHGIYVETMANGDKIRYTFTASSTSDKGMMKTATDKWTIASGTGKFKGLKGSGTCNGKGNADGSSDWTCTGTYTMGK